MKTAFNLKQKIIEEIENDTIDDISNVITPEIFSKEVEYNVKQGCSYLEAIMVVAEKIGLDVEDPEAIKPMLLDSIKSQLYVESVNNRLIKDKRLSTLDEYFE